MSYEIETADGLRRLRTAREDFLSNRRLPADFPAWLGEAWRRARFFGLDVERAQVPTAAWAPESDLIRAATPVLQGVAASLAGLRAAVVLSDERARIVGAWAGEPASRGHLDGIGTRAGADLSEAAVGSNGISHVLLTRRPAVIGGPEHLLGLYQQTVCAGAPIYGPRSSRPVGAVAVVAQLDAPSPVLQALAATAAASVERELLHSSGGQQRKLLETFLRAGRDGAPVVVLDGGTTRLVSDAAAALLDSKGFEVLEAHALAAAREGRVPDSPVPLGDLDVLLRLATPDDTPGIVARILTGANRTTPRAHRRAGPGLFSRAGLAGGSPVWGSLERAVLRAGGRPLLLTGEPGVGKSAVAGAALGDATVVPAENDPGFLDVLGRLLGEGHPVVIRRLDLLTVRRLTETASVLAEASGPVAATWRTGEPVAAELRSVWSPYELRVPALRDRGEDIIEIARELAPTARFTVAARTLLGRYPWPGNVTELRAVLRCALTAAGTAPIAPAHLPADLGAAAALPRLTELEKAERNAIVEALRSTDGNRSHAAVLLGIGRATLYRKIRRYRLD